LPPACPSKIQFGNALTNNSCRAIAPVARQGSDPSTPVGSSDALRAQQQSMRMAPVVAAQQFFSANAASPRASYSYHQVLISPGSARVVSPGAWRTRWCRSARRYWRQLEPRQDHHRNWVKRCQLLSAASAQRCWRDRAASSGEPGSPRSVSYARGL